MDEAAEKLQAAFATSEDLGIPDSPAVAEPVEVPQTQITEPPVASNVNPAWQTLLDEIPEVLHDRVKGKLAEWDQNYQKSFDKYKPFDEFVGVDPGQLKAARQLYQTLEQDPRRVYEGLRAHLEAQGQLPEEIQNNEVDLSEDDDEHFDDPRLAQIEKVQQQMLAYQQAQEQQRATQEADKWLEQQQATFDAEFKKKGIEADWNMILTQAAGLSQSMGIDPPVALEKAVQQFESFVSKYRPSANSTAPLLMSPSGGTPATPAIDVAKMDDKQRKQLGAQLLAKAMRDL